MQETCTNINIRISRDRKDEVDEMCAYLGCTVSNLTRQCLFFMMRQIKKDAHVEKIMRERLRSM